MTWFWKACGGGVALMVLCLGAGCSGINAQQSVSPASLILPGLMRAEPPAVAPAEGARTPYQIAQTR